LSLVGSAKQRDGPHKGGDVTEEEKEALINFKNDWENNFSYYDKLITISGRSYDKDQKEGIRAVKTNGNSISIILGKRYSTEADEQTRWKWIKTEVIDKNLKADKFEDVAYDPIHSKLKEIGPPDAVGQYCTRSFARSLSQDGKRIASCMQSSQRSNRRLWVRHKHEYVFNVCQLGEGRSDH
jgi:hypothetical protein